MYYRNANCAVVVYDITQSSSLEKARSWVRELQRQADPSIVIALCGNKTDLSARRQVSQEEAKKYADEEGLMWGETSAKSGEGVSDIFTAIGESLSEYFRFPAKADCSYSQEVALVYPAIQARCQPCIRRPRRAGRRRPQQETYHRRESRELQLLGASSRSSFKVWPPPSCHCFGCPLGFVHFGTIFMPVVNMLARFHIHYTDLLYHPKTLYRDRWAFGITSPAFGHGSTWVYVLGWRTRPNDS